MQDFNTRQQPRRPSSSFITSTRAPSPKAPGAALLAAADGAVGPVATAACGRGAGFALRATVPPPLSRKGSRLPASPEASCIGKRPCMSRHMIRKKVRAR